MMMTQWGLAQREHDARARKVSRAAAVVMALGVAVLCAGGSAKAAAHPVHVRRAAASSQTSGVQTGHAKLPGVASRAHAGKNAAKNTSSKGVPEKGNQARNSAAQRKTAANAGKSAARAKTQRRKQPSQTDDHDPPVFHRVSASRRRGDRQGRRVEREFVARAPRDEPVLAASFTESKDAQRVDSAPATAEVKPLTVDDFLRAASTPSTPAAGIYASGESHPDEDVSSSQKLAAASATRPLPIKRPVVVARVEAAPVESEPAPIQRTAPSDLVGAPDAAPQRTTRIAGVKDESTTPGLRAPSRQELIAEVEQPMVLLGLYRNGRLLVPPPLKGTREILVHQNLMADDEGLERVQDDFDLRRMRATRQLVDFPESASLHVNPELAGNRRCARPWTVRFASDMARAYYARFHQPLQVNSAVRTVAYQVRLRRVNGNAAGVDGDVASPHLTGEALDFGKRGMSVEEIAWMRIYLLPLMQAGKLDVEEEFQQACFHISVYRAYLPATRRSEIAQLREPRVPKVASRADQDQ